MALSNMTVVSDGTLEYLSLSFDYLERSEITVYFDSVPTIAWSWVGDTNQIQFSPLVPNGVTVLVARSTDASELRHVFSEGAAFTARTLDEDLRQVLHIVQEAKETNLSGDFYNDIDMHNNKILNLGTAVNDNEAISLGQYKADALGANAARDQAEDARDAALGYRNQAEGFKNTTLGYRNDAEGFKNTAQSSATTATTQAGNASGSATQALGYRNTTLGYRNEAEGFRDDAQQAVIDASNASRLTAGTVTTGAPGSSAAATITGSPGSQSLNLTIPRGEKGEPGDVQGGSTLVSGHIAYVESLSPTTIRSGDAGTGVFGIGATGASTQLDGSFDVTTGAGVYYAGANPTDNPGGLRPILWHRVAGSAGAQIVVDEDGVSFTRGRTSSAWGSWKRNWTSADFSIYLGGPSPSVNQVMAASPTSIELYSLGSGARTSYIDFHSRDGTDYDARITKTDGATSPLTFIATDGTVNNVLSLNSSSQTLDFNMMSNAGIYLLRGPATGGGIDSSISIRHNGTAVGRSFLTAYYNGSAIGSITVASSSSVAFNTSSDYRLKEDVREIPNALYSIEQINPVLFRWKGDGISDMGVIAHELQEVLPHAVTGEKDAVDEEGKPKYQQVDYSKIVPILIKGIQELSEELKELRERIT